MMESNGDSNSDVSVIMGGEGKPSKARSQVAPSKSKMVVRKRNEYGNFVRNSDAPPDKPTKSADADSEDDEDEIEWDDRDDKEYKNYPKDKRRSRKKQEPKVKKLKPDKEFRACLKFNDRNHDAGDAATENIATTIADDDDDDIKVEIDADDVPRQQKHSTTPAPANRMSFFQTTDKSQKNYIKPASIFASPAAAAAAIAATATEIPPSSKSSGRPKHDSAVAIQNDAVANFFRAYKIAHPQESSEECRAYTIKEMTRQGVPYKLVYRVMQRLLAKNNMSFDSKVRRRPPNATPLEDVEDLRNKFREYVDMVGDGDMSKVSMRKFAESVDKKYQFVMRMLKTDDELSKQLKKRNALEESNFEARRSFVVAKFIEFSGTLNERRNACCRYFFKTPHYDHKMIKAACNRFIKYGTVRSHEKNKATVWFGEQDKRPAEEISPEEAEFLQALNTEHERLERNLHSAKNKGSQGSEDDDDDDDDVGTSNGKKAGKINKSGKDVVADLTKRNVLLERELLDSKNALARAQLHVQQLQQQQQIYELRSSS